MAKYTGSTWDHDAGITHTSDLFYPSYTLYNNLQQTAIENFNHENLIDGHQSNFKEKLGSATLFDESKSFCYDKKVSKFSLKKKSYDYENLTCDQKHTKSIPVNNSNKFLAKFKR